MGPEANLVASAIETMVDALLMHVDVDWVEESAVYQTGIAIFDQQTPSQRIWLLHDVTQHLLTETDSTLPPGALTDATVAAVYAEIRDQLAIEAGLYTSDSPAEEPGIRWRQLVLEAYLDVKSKAESGSADVDWEPQEDDPDIPTLYCDDINEWEYLIDFLADSILWDRDFELADSFLDLDPEESRARREIMGIGDDYFMDIPDDPPAYEAMRLASITRQITRRKPR